VLCLLHNDAQKSHLELRGTRCANVLTTDGARRIVRGIRTKSALYACVKRANLSFSVRYSNLAVHSVCSQHRAGVYNVFILTYCRLLHSAHFLLVECYERTSRVSKRVQLKRLEARLSSSLETQIPYRNVS